MHYKEYALTLCARHGPSGFEEPAAEKLRELLKGLVDETWTDVLGNVVGVRRCGKENAKKLLLDAHIDEIGLIITGASEGFLRFSSIGGVDPRMLPAREVRILTEPERMGVVVTMPVHALTAAEQDAAAKIEDMLIDAGLAQEEAEALVPPGTPAIPAGDCSILNSTRLCGRSLDDRCCMAAILSALELLKNETLDYDLYVLGSVQEELGTRGAIAGAYSIAPDWCVAVDVTHAATPDSGKKVFLKSGAGTAIGVGPNMTKNLSDKLLRLAKEKAIPYQIEAMGGRTGTNAWPIQVSRSGVATALLSIPLKYMHSPSELIELSDGEATARLLYEFCLSLKGGCADA